MLSPRKLVTSRHLDRQPRRDPNLSTQQLRAIPIVLNLVLDLLPKRLLLLLLFLHLNRLLILLRSEHLALSRNCLSHRRLLRRLWRLRRLGTGSLNRLLHGLSWERLLCLLGIESWGRRWSGTRAGRCLGVNMSLQHQQDRDLRRQAPADTRTEGRSPRTRKANPLSAQRCPRNCFRVRIQSS